MHVLWSEYEVTDVDFEQTAYFRKGLIGMVAGRRPMGLGIVYDLDRHTLKERLDY